MKPHVNLQEVRSVQELAATALRGSKVSLNFALRSQT